MKKLTFGSLFAGIGGFDLGLERAGLVCKWQVEIDPFCQRVLQKHWPDVPKYGDIRDVGSKELEPVDIVTGGFPCQDLSIAGNRKGLAGERSGLYWQMRRVIRELKPQWFVIENVPGLLSSNDGRDFAIVLRGLAKCGYSIAWRVLDAQYFGLAQRRKRVFIVGSLGNGSSTQILFEREGSARDTPPGRKAGARITGGTQKGIGIGSSELGYGLRSNPSHSGDKGDGGVNTNFVVTFGGNNTNGLIDRATAVNAHGSRRYDFESETFVFQQNTRDEVRLMGGDGQIAGVLPAQPGMKQQNYVYNAFNGYTGGADDNDAQGGHLVASVAPTLQKDSYSPTKSSTGQQLDWCISQSAGVRRLTPIECERLQGFPDGHTEGQSDTQRYRQLGNAVAVPVAEWIGCRLFDVTQEV